MTDYRPKRTPALDATIRRMVAQGVRKELVARHVGVNESTVRVWLRMEPLPAPAESGESQRTIPSVTRLVINRDQLNPMAPAFVPISVPRLEFLEAD